jgi:membrane associated rhomboid family serine protease
MGIYDRDYYRRSRSFRDSSGWDGLTPAVKFLLIANIVVFVLQILVLREVRRSPLERLRELNPDIDKLLTQAQQEEGPEALESMPRKHPNLFKNLSQEELQALFLPAEKVSVLQEWFELDVRKVKHGQVWRLLTYAFCHDRYGVWHIFFNMLCLYWFGGTLERMYGTREFVLFYLAAAVVSGGTFMTLNLYTGSTAACIGASGAVIAVMMLYTMHFPREIIYICWVLPVEMRWVMAVYLIWDLHPVLLALSGDQYATGVAHAAHLGGLAFGFLYAKFEWRVAALGERVPWLGWTRRPRLRLHREPDPAAQAEFDAEMSRVDQVLQKICASGQASLTEEERALLKKASERLKNRSRRP